MATMTRHWHVLTALKRGAQTSRKLVVVPNTVVCRSTLLELSKLGIIINYRIIGHYIIIYLRSAIQVMRPDKVGRKFSYTHHNQLKNVTSYYILNTDKGLLSNTAAAQKGIGGKPLVKVV